ncbi:MAG: hypothetical protein K6A33_06855 [Clostridiales bacterium]|nr:hypothetical protein [Clostridiales bacterium]
MRSDPLLTRAEPVLAFAAAFLSAFALFRASDAVYTVLSVPRGVPEMLAAELPMTVMLLVTALSPFTRFCRPILIAGCFWRGAALGCLLAFLTSERLAGIRPVTTAVLAILSALVYLALAAECQAAHPGLMAGGGTREHLKTSLVFAGAHFLIDLALI